MSQDFNLDLTNIENDDSPIGAMPAGVYELQGNTWQVLTSKASGNRMIKVEYDVIGPNYAGAFDAKVVLPMPSVPAMFIFIAGTLIPVVTSFSKLIFIFSSMFCE